MRRFSDPRVASLFKAYPPTVRVRLMALRDVVLDTADRTAGVGRLTETLKWVSRAISPRRRAAARRCASIA
jgi:hypothetical protein